MIRRPPRSTLFPTRRSSDLHRRRPWDPQREGGDLLSGEGDRTGAAATLGGAPRSEEHTSELQSRPHLVCRLLLEKKKYPLYFPVLGYAPTRNWINNDGSTAS